MSADAVVLELGTDQTRGIDPANAAKRLAEHGPDRLPAAKARGPVKRFLSQLNNLLVYVLLAAGFTTLMLGLWIDAGIIFGVVLLNALLGFVQEGKAEKALESIRSMLSAEARTLRAGEARLIPAEELVPGDSVLLESGDKIPADLRLVDTSNPPTEEAALTGESVPADTSVERVPEKATVGDRHNMGFSGTRVVSGRATGAVVATGGGPELGRINAPLAGVSALETPLLRSRLARLYARGPVFGCWGRAPRMIWPAPWPSMPSPSARSSTCSIAATWWPRRRFRSTFGLGCSWRASCSSWSSSWRSWSFACCRVSGAP